MNTPPLLTSAAVLMSAILFAGCNPSEKTSSTILVENSPTSFKSKSNDGLWSLTIDDANQLHFKGTDSASLDFGSTDVSKAQDAKHVRYRSVSEEGELIVTLSEGDCKHEEHKTPPSHSVLIELKRSGESDYTEFKGCGSFVPDFKLHNIWTLVAINGEDLDVSKLNSNGAPIFEFFSKEGRISAFSGCNNFNGTFYIAEPGVLQLGMFMGTRMMCENMGIEDLLNQKFFGKRLSYELTHMHLSLSTSAGDSIKLKKIN